MHAALLAATFAYSLLMTILYAILATRHLEKCSRRPELLRATWAAATLLPLTPLTPTTLALLPVAAMLGYRGNNTLCAITLAVALTATILQVIL